MSAALKAVQVVAPGEALALPFDVAVLTADQRHLRRKLITLRHGVEVLFDFPLALHLRDKDRVLLEDGRNFEVIAAAEALLEITASSPQHLAQLAWHIGNRHLEAQIAADHILIRHDHVIAGMLAGLGAKLRDVTAPFSPEHGAYAHGH